MQRPVPWTKRLRRRARFEAIRLAVGAASTLPLAALYALGRAAAAVAPFVARRTWRRALAGLTQAFPDLPDAERRALARACFVHLGRCLAELLALRRLDATIDALVAWPPDSRGVMEAALARKKGVLYVTGHIGHWELLARRVGLAGYPANVIAKESWHPKLTEAIDALRGSGRVNTIWRGRPDAAKRMLKLLRAGEFLGVLIDQDTDVQSVWAPFFGRPAKTPRGVADLALRTGAAVLVGACQRAPDGRYVLTAEEVPVPAEDTEANVLALTATLNAKLEALIRRAPEQWVWFHERWKSPPPAQPPDASSSATS